MEERFELLRVRKMLGWSQEITAAYLGVSKPYLSRMENGAKPLNRKALRFISLYEEGKTNPTPRTPPKRAKKDNLKLLKIKPPAREIQPNFSRFEQVSDLSRFEWKKWWWRDFNPLCLKCKRACKQSIQAKVIVCPQYRKER